MGKQIWQHLSSLLHMAELNNKSASASRAKFVANIRRFFEFLSTNTGLFWKIVAFSSVDFRLCAVIKNDGREAYETLLIKLFSSFSCPQYDVIPLHSNPQICSINNIPIFSMCREKKKTKQGALLPMFTLFVIASWAQRMKIGYHRVWHICFPDLARINHWKSNFHILMDHFLN